MHRQWGRGFRALGAVVAILATGGCGDDNAQEAQSPLVITMAPTKSGDQQIGRAGEAVLSALRVLVTRDGEPVSGIPVRWGTGTGSISPSQGSTATDGTTAGVWTLGEELGTQNATASVNGATNSPIVFSATANDQTDPGPVTIRVLGGGSTGANQFDPAEITVAVGTTVSWEWADGAVSHNVVPDDGTTPAQSGPPVNGPTTYHYTFNSLGTFHYHCQTHGSAMSGVVNVVTFVP